MVLRTLPAGLSRLAKYSVGWGLEQGAPGDDARSVAGMVKPCTEFGLNDLLENYARGFYLRGSAGGAAWWASRQRMVLFTDGFRLGDRFAAKLKLGRFRVTLDRAFAAVVEGCAEGWPRLAARNALTEEIAELFCDAHHAGFAHSVEVWDKKGALVGGGFGLAMGKMFFTEAQFQRQPDAARLGFAVLNRHLRERGFLANDGKQVSGLLAQQGFQPVSRARFEHFLEKATAIPQPLGRWRLGEDGDARDGRFDAGFLGVA